MPVYLRIIYYLLHTKNDRHDIMKIVERISLRLKILAVTKLMLLGLPKNAHLKQDFNP